MSSILPKKELENVNFCPRLLEQKFFVHFLGELKKPNALSKLTDLSRALLVSTFKSEETFLDIEM